MTTIEKVEAEVEAVVLDADTEPEAIPMLNGNLFSDMTELLVFKRREEEDGKGMYNIPKEMLDAYQAAYADLMRYQQGIIEWLRTSKQHIPFPHGELIPPDVKPADPLGEAVRDVFDDLKP